MLAVFQPDGSGTVPGERFVVVGETVLEVHLARWSGRMTLTERIEAPAEVSEDEPLEAGAGSDPEPTEPSPPVGKKGAEK